MEPEKLAEFKISVKEQATTKSKTPVPLELQLCNNNNDKNKIKNILKRLYVGILCYYSIYQIILMTQICL